MDSTQFERLHFQRLSKLSEIKQLDPVAFERFIGSLFERMGYEVQTTPESGDEGIDLILTKENKISIVQCKRFENQVGQPVVRDLYGVLVHTQAETAFLVTTGHFSLPAQTWAAGKPIQLIDGHTLCEWVGLVQPPPLDFPPPPLPVFKVGVSKIKRIALNVLAILGIALAVLFGFLRFK